MCQSQYVNGVWKWERGAKYIRSFGVIFQETVIIHLLSREYHIHVGKTGKKEIPSHFNVIQMLEYITVFVHYNLEEIHFQFRSC